MPYVYKFGNTADQGGREGFGLVLVVVNRLGPKALTYSLPQALTLNPSNPTDRKATTNQIQMLLTFFPVRVRVTTRIHAIWGLA